MIKYAFLLFYIVNKLIVVYIKLKEELSFFIKRKNKVN